MYKQSVRDVELLQTSACDFVCMLHLSLDLSEYDGLLITRVIQEVMRTSV